MTTRDPVRCRTPNLRGSPSPRAGNKTGTTARTDARIRSGVVSPVTERVRHAPGRAATSGPGHSPAQDRSDWLDELNTPSADNTGAGIGKLQDVLVDTTPTDGSKGRETEFKCGAC